MELFIKLMAMLYNSLYWESQFLSSAMAELIVIVQVGCLCVDGWVCGWVGTFVRMCVSNFMFNLGLSLVFSRSS